MREFRIAAFPVTIAEFNCFVMAGGYDDSRWWKTEAAKKWWEGELCDEEGRLRQLYRYWNLVAEPKMGVSMVSSAPTQHDHDWALQFASLSPLEAWNCIVSWYPKRKKRKPDFWGDEQYSSGLKPVVGITFFEAEAYCAWLSHETKTHFCIPTEAQWEISVRRKKSHSIEASTATNRIWPWGSTPPTQFQINFAQSGIGSTSPTGIFPESNTIEGLADAAGNVFEWTSSKWTSSGLDPASVNSITTGTEMRAVRGGAWLRSGQHCRTRYRNGSSPLGSYFGMGFRLITY